MEKKRISETLHDGIGQILAATKMHFSSLEKEIPGGRHKIIDSLLTQAIVETRSLSHILKPPNFLKYGFVVSVEKMMETINVDFDVTKSWVNVDSDLELQLYRIIQELISNAIKHSKGDKVELKINIEEGKYKLIFIDNRLGFDLETMYKRSYNGAGLENIDNRVELLKGKINRYYRSKFYTEIEGEISYVNK